MLAPDVGILSVVVRREAEYCLNLRTDIRGCASVVELGYVADCWYVLDQEPKYVVLVCAKVGGRVVIRGFETDKRLYRHPRFKAGYRLLPEESRRFFYKNAYSYWVFGKKDS